MGDSSYAEIAGSAALCPAAVTAEVFFWLENHAPVSFFSSYAAQPCSWELGLFTDGHCYMRTNNGTTDNVLEDIRSAVDYAPASFIHVVGQADAAHTNLFMQGWQVAANNFVRTNTRTDNVRLGARAFPGAEAYASCFITRAALYSTILPAARVLAHFQASGLGQILNGATGTIAADTGATNEAAILASVRKTY
jgi:hypothetical protein